jgi:hypothetical protein
MATKEYQLTKPVRVFARSGGERSSILKYVFTASTGSFVLLSEPVQMVFDHRDVKALPCRNMPSGHFLLEEETQDALDAPT